MANELTCPLTGAEEGLWQEKLAALLVRQIALYTANESSSVPAAAARELLRGVLFFLAVPEEADGGGEGRFDALTEDGQALARGLILLVDAEDVAALGVLGHNPVHQGRERNGIHFFRHRCSSSYVMFP